MKRQKYAYWFLALAAISLLINLFFVWLTQFFFIRKYPGDYLTWDDHLYRFPVTFWFLIKIVGVGLILKHSKKGMVLFTAGFLVSCYFTWRSWPGILPFLGLDLLFLVSAFYYFTRNSRLPDKQPLPDSGGAT